MIFARNVLVWLISVLVSVGLFSFIYAGMNGPGSFLFVFRITLILALPAVVVFALFLSALDDGKGGRTVLTLCVGTLIGPGSLFLWNLRGGSRNIAFQGDDIGPGLGGYIIISLILSFVTTSVYAVAKKLIYRLTKS